MVLQGVPGNGSQPDNHDQPKDGPESQARLCLVGGHSMVIAAAAGADSGPVAVVIVVLFMAGLFVYGLRKRKNRR